MRGIRERLEQSLADGWTVEWDLGGGMASSTSPVETGLIIQPLLGRTWHQPTGEAHG